ncbi:hypothetical protein ACC739_36690, partial [Rhizobium ruizarguesonis]
ACGLARYLSADFMVLFKAMFNYRNFMFHGGFEWSVGNRQLFTELIEKKDGSSSLPARRQEVRHGFTTSRMKPSTGCRIA